MLPDIPHGSERPSQMVHEERVALGSSACAQLTLPGFATHILADLPASLCVPVPGGDPDDDDERSYRPLAGRHGITVVEAEAALALLEAGIADDQRKARAIREALDIAHASGAEPSDRLAEALAQAADVVPAATWARPPDHHDAPPA